jgi:hypothetical protein
MLSFVLYRTSGRALLDNVVQVLRTICLIAVVASSHVLGFRGVLAGMVLTEFVGMSVMLFALTRTFDLFQAKSLLPDTLRVVAAATLILGMGALVSYIPLPLHIEGRFAATLKLFEICLACAIVGLPALACTGSVTRAEGRALFSGFIPKSRNTTPALAHHAAE